jgi:hypothetical protein
MIRGLVLSAGMPRAGSGWHYNLVHDLIVAGGGQDARQVRRKYRLQHLLTEVNCNIGTLSPYRLIPVLLPALLGNTFAVKTHAGPTAAARWLIRRGRLTPTYIFRDPRAALLSAFEVGRRAAAQGRVNDFSALASLDQAAEFMEYYVRIWERWMAVDGLLSVRYEDLVAEYDREVRRLVAYLGLSDGDEQIKSVVARYRPEQGDSARRGTHFSQGETERFRRVLPPEQLQRVSDAFAGLLQRMGYRI